MILLLYVVVIASVNLNNQSGRQANEVCYVGSNDVLPPERFSQFALFQKHPKLTFCLCRHIPHPLGMFLQNRIKTRVSVAVICFMSVKHCEPPPRSPFGGVLLCCRFFGTESPPRLALRRLRSPIALLPTGDCPFGGVLLCRCSFGGVLLCRRFFAECSCL